MVVGALLTPKISNRIPVEKMYVYFYAVSLAIFGMGCSTSIYNDSSAITRQMAVCIFAGMGFYTCF